MPRSIWAFAVALLLIVTIVFAQTQESVQAETPTQQTRADGEVLNPTFDTDIAFWEDCSTGNEWIEWYAKSLQLISSGGYAQACQTIPTTVGGIYRMTFESIGDFTWARIFCATAFGGEDVCAYGRNYPSGTWTGTLQSLTFTALTDATYLRFSNGGGTYTIDNITIVQIGGPTPEPTATATPVPEPTATPIPEATATPNTVELQPIATNLAYIEGEALAIAQLLQEIQQTALQGSIAQAAEPQTLSVVVGESADIPNMPTGFTFFGQNLAEGMSGPDCRALQAFLNYLGFTVASSGPGSPGNETEYCGPLTTAAVIAFQEFYAQDVLAPWGLTVGTGFAGETTIAKLNNLLIEARAGTSNTTMTAAAQEICLSNPEFNGVPPMTFCTAVPRDREIFTEPRDGNPNYWVYMRLGDRFHPLVVNGVTIEYDDGAVFFRFAGGTQRYKPGTMPFNWEALTQLGFTSIADVPAYSTPDFIQPEFLKIFFPELRGMETFPHALLQSKYSELFSGKALTANEVLQHLPINAPKPESVMPVKITYTVDTGTGTLVESGDVEVELASESIVHLIARQLDGEVYMLSCGVPVGMLASIRHLGVFGGELNLYFDRANNGAGFAILKGQIGPGLEGSPLLCSVTQTDALPVDFLEPEFAGIKLPQLKISGELSLAIFLRGSLTGTPLGAGSFDPSLELGTEIGAFAGMTIEIVVEEWDNWTEFAEDLSRLTCKFRSANPITIGSAVDCIPSSE